jgi:hypothetical protein
VAFTASITRSCLIRLSAPALAAAPAGLTSLVDTPVATAGVGAPASPPYGHALEPAPRGNRWMWPLVGLAALLLVWFGLRSRTAGVGATDSAVATGTAALDSAAARTGAAVSAAGGAISDAARELGAFGKRVLPGGVELNIPERGIEANLINLARQHRGRPQGIPERQREDRWLHRQHG